MHPLRRYLMLAAFVALVVLPTGVALPAVGAMLAVSAIRGARSIAGRRADRRREGEIVLGVDNAGQAGPARRRRAVGARPDPWRKRGR